MRTVYTPSHGASKARVALATALLLVATVAVAVTTWTAPSASAAGAVTIWGTTAPTPALVDSDTAAVELGTRFTAVTKGQATGVRFYKTATNTGVHTGTVWTSSGSLLGRATFAGETATGWQTATFTTPITLTAGRSYVVSYHTNVGHYLATQRFQGASKSPSYLKVGTSNVGVYAYGTSSRFPKSTWNSSMYWVDLTFAPAVTPTVGSTPTTSATPTGSPIPTTSPTPTRSPTPTTSPTATPTPTPTATTPSGGGTVVLGRSFPNSDTTGVPAGTTLTPYTGSCSIQTNNVVIDSKILNCDLRIVAQGVTIRKSIINGTIYSDNGSFTLTDSEVRMPQSTATGIGDANFVVTRVEVTGGNRSINCAANCTVTDSFLHGQYTDRRGIDHESAIRMGAGSVIRHNYITCDATPVPPDSGCSAALTGYGDFAIVQKNTIDNNLIDGGPYGSMGFCAYGGSTTGKPYSAGVNNIKFTNNIFMRGTNGKCGIWGPITSFDSGAPGNVWTNNLWNDGTTVPPAN